MYQDLLLDIKGRPLQLDLEDLHLVFKALDPLLHPHSGIQLQGLCLPLFLSVA